MCVGVQLFWFCGCSLCTVTSSLLVCCLLLDGLLCSEFLTLSMGLRVF